MDEEHLNALKSLCTKVRPDTEGLTPKNRDRLRQFDDSRNVWLLLNFTTAEFEAAIKADQGRRLDAVRVQVALAVAILLMMPVRAANLVGLHMERHIQRTRSGNGFLISTFEISTPGLTMSPAPGYSPAVSQANTRLL